MQKLDVFNYVASRTSGRDLADIIWYDSEVCFPLPCILTPLYYHLSPLTICQTTDVWFERRRTFSESNAIMSMVGYVLGLGDRHPSNLMIEKKTARVVHIDFGDCFEVARDREKFAECVPFRLTRMMINAMDVGALRGSFRRNCERVMTLLRTNKGSIMAMLEAFVLDPLANWFTIDVERTHRNRTQSRRGDGQDGADPTQAWLSYGPHGVTDHGMFNRPQSRTIFYPAEANREQTKGKASLALIRVEAKLKGREFSSAEQKTVGQQVNLLIEEATSPENLSQLFLGWCPLW